MAKRPEDDLMKMLQSDNPMDVDAQPIPNDLEMMLPENVMGNMPVVNGEMPPDTLPPGQEEEIAPSDLPEEATVESVDSGYVVLIADNGQRLEVPLEAFPIPPKEGMVLYQATVAEKTKTGIMAVVRGEQIEIKDKQLQQEFEVGDYFWMPEPPKSADKLR